MAVADSSEPVCPETCVEAGARALAWATLTPYGRVACDWLQDFSEAERAAFRAQARCALTAAKQAQAAVRDRRRA